MQINNRLMPRHFSLFTLLAAKENKFFTDSYRKDVASSGFTLVSTSVKLKGVGVNNRNDSDLRVHWERVKL